MINVEKIKSMQPVECVKNVIENGGQKHFQDLLKTINGMCDDGL